MKNNNPLPDIQSQNTRHKNLPLQWVGMENIAVPLNLTLAQGTQKPSAQGHIFVNLVNTQAKGIHMSRLYRLLNQLSAEECDQTNITTLLRLAVASQAGLSDCAKLQLDFDITLNKPALLSQESGSQRYPISLIASNEQGRIHYELKLTIPYSSTCPCSASLSRQLSAQAIDKQFTQSHIDKAQLLKWLQSEHGSIATPHSQRSYAYLHLHLEHNSQAQWNPLDKFIFQFEEVIGTPVQTAVKREDEQEFARLNAKNLMFCEDAARRLKANLESMDFVKDYQFKVEHQESLHAHNAVAYEQKYY
ncbi:GTP cyclohydrolase FolE2 [Pseudoalteromonas sp. MMG005]|uniref:GTP cyclohydrolase FolE2 n=1 Tax=Pseudoalteromonas sp. MMG005 TaxID=2822682 RepID=UPI001B3A54C6|nr:GTP cyclohydrolase FolE2 [Pseudoalteromonas sp. MMG005]MBQ4846560.1 GTP cyclohydrolase I FolE2 [Pseudoalteromonas sp. MMG005]